MLKRTKRILSLLLMLALAMALFSAAVAEDWRDILKWAFGQEDAGTPEDGEQWSDPITDPQEIVNYLDAYGRLPDNFITKKEAQALGWNSSYNYVGDVAPGKSIGGDRFGNYEGRLPDAKGRKWFECDIGYNGKKRGAKRLVYSSDGLYYYTADHYQTFTKMLPEGRR